MQKKNCVLCISIGIIVCILLSACSRQPDFDAKEEDGVYTVSVQVEPSNVFQTLQQSSTEVSNEKIKQGLDGNDPEVFAAVLTESVQKSLEKNRYGKAVTVNVSVEKDNSGKYGLLDTEMNKLEAAMFPTE